MENTKTVYPTKNWTDFANADKFTFACAQQVTREAGTSDGGYTWASLYVYFLQFSILIKITYSFDTSKVIFF